MDEVVLARSWWSLVLRGLLGVAIGIITVFAPGITLGALVILFGAYALMDGIMGLTGVWHASRSGERWGALLLHGLAGIAAAAVTVLWPAVTVLALVLLIGAWAIVTGIFQIVAAVRLRRYISGEWLLALGGILSVIFGVLVMIAPLAGALAIAIWFGAYAFVSGVILVALGFRLRARTSGGYNARSPLPAPGR